MQLRKAHTQPAGVALLPDNAVMTITVLSNSLANPCGVLFLFFVGILTAQPIHGHAAGFPQWHLALPLVR